MKGIVFERIRQYVDGLFLGYDAKAVSIQKIGR